MSSTISHQLSAAAADAIMQAINVADDQADAEGIRLTADLIDAIAYDLEAIGDDVMANTTRNPQDRHSGRAGAVAWLIADTLHEQAAKLRNQPA